MLHGRINEQEAVATLIDEARRGRGGALVLHGQPGVGKSELLAHAVARGEGMNVLRTQGIESESPLAFAALHRLLRPAMGFADELPSPQSKALRAAFGEEAGDGADRFLVFLAALSLLSEAAEHGPLLGVIDDAQWLDDASAAALLFVARRLQVERVALLFAAREGEVRRFDIADLPALEVRGLNSTDAAALLTECAGVAVPLEVTERLVGETVGNPLALLELADALSPGELAGEAPLPRQLPLTGGVERAFLDRCRRLTADAQTLLLVAAVDDSGQLTTVSQAASELGVAELALDAVERSGLLRVSDSQVEFHHPLVRSAVYGAATSLERRRVHGVFAEILLGEDPDRRAWHLAAAVDKPDASVVEELDRVAERALQRGGLEGACAAWQRAAELSSGGEPRAERQYAAARAAWLAGQGSRARNLVSAAYRQTADPGLRADVARLRARIEWNTGSIHTGHRMIMQAAQEVAPVDAQRAREMAMFGAALASFGADSEVDIDPLDLIDPPSEGAPARERCFAALLVGLDHVVRGNWAEAVPSLREAFVVAESLGPEDQDLLPNLGIAALQLGDDTAAFRYHGLLLARARDTGAVVMILYSLARLAITQIATGEWAAADSGASEALRLAHDTGQPTLAGLPLAALSVTAAMRGDDAYDTHLSAAEELVSTQPLGILDGVIRDLIRWAKGMRADGQPASAFHHLSQISQGMVRRLAAFDRLEAATRAGQREEAAAWLRELEEWASATRAAWAEAAVSHGRAVLADGEDTQRYFEQALKLHSRSSHLLDRARTELAFGESLRRARRRVDARAHLRAALETFEDLGTRPWAERARQELRASGETTRRRDPSTATELTPQERQVAGLVAQGMSNREVATQLFLSPRTIDFHLRNVFAKAGVSSRTELAHLQIG